MGINKTFFILCWHFQHWELPFGCSKDSEASEKCCDVFFKSLLRIHFVWFYAKLWNDKFKLQSKGSAASLKIKQGCQAFGEAEVILNHSWYWWFSINTEISGWGHVIENPRFSQACILLTVTFHTALFLCPLLWNWKWSWNKQLAAKINEWSNSSATGCWFSVSMETEDQLK